MSGNAACGGEGHARVSPLVASATSERCRRPPTTSDACAIRARAAGDRASRPSSPIPMIESQRAYRAALMGLECSRGRTMRLLILGGTTEAAALAGRIANRRDLDPVLSFAGRTRNPVAPPIPFRVGGFGGVEGLRTYLADQLWRRRWSMRPTLSPPRCRATRSPPAAPKACRSRGSPGRPGRASRTTDGRTWPTWGQPPPR